jgi:ParB/RepB/Spo0J family partition protein
MEELSMSLSEFWLLMSIFLPWLIFFGMVTTKPLSFFKPDPKQPRKTFDENDLRRLGESLRAKQIQPVLTQPDGTIIAGERRYRAACLVGLEILEVKIADLQMTEPEVRRWQLVENMLRDGLKAIEQVDGLEELARLNPALSNKELSELLGIDASMVTRLRSVARCIPAVREALGAGSIGVSDAYAISKLPDSEQAGLLALKLSGASRDQLEAEGRKSRNGGKEVVRVQKVKCALPNGVNVVVSGEGVSLEESIEALGEAIKEMKRARELGYTAKTFAAAMKDKSKKG